MSFNSEYLELREKRKKKKKEEETITTTKPYAKKLYEKQEDIAPVLAPTMAERLTAPTVVTTPTVAPEKEWYDKIVKKPELFDDGYQLGDISKTILGTASDFSLGVLTGVGNFAEGIADSINYGVADVSDLVGAKSFAQSLREETKKSVVQKLLGETTKQVDKWSVLGDTSDSVAQGLGMIATLVAGGSVLGSAGVGTGGITALTTGATGVSSYGSGMSEAYQGGATDEEARTYGLISGTADALSELLFGGLGKGINAVGFSKGLSSADDMLAKKVSDMFSSQITKNLAEYGIKASAEGFEEVLSGVAQGIGKKITYMSEKDIGDILKDESLLEQFVVGAVTSGFAQAGDFYKATKTGTDFVTGLTENEQKVIDKEVENRIAESETDGTKLTKKQKEKIKEDVLKDLDKGYINIDTIESALGGETYDNYKSITEQEDSLQNEFNTLNQMKQGDMTGEQIDKRAELKQQLEELKNNSKRTQIKEQLSNEVFGLAKGSRLAESYNEKARRGQTFEADLSKYDAKQQEVIKKAVESGILNNTNRTHEFVDMVAKISADKGVSFDFTNNEKLKTSGFAVEGKTVNGYVTSDGNIAVNIDSGKSLNSIVGHEITHILEGTELHTALQQTITEYAKTKGEYQSRYDALAELYEGVEGANIDNELTADLVGDYLFTDADFINNLSTKQPNLFKRIYDEIKYLCKIATAGSKEARELEKVKRAFDKAYKESANKTNTDTETTEDTHEGNTKYSLVTDEDTIAFLENQDYVVTYKAMQVIDGKLYPPMSAEHKVEEEYTNKKGEKKVRTVKKLKQPSELGKWQQSEENVELAKQSYDAKKGYSSFELLKGDGKSLKGVAYNPYEHTSNIVLNDQFSSAHRRDNLVTVEYHIPVSELTSGYKAEYSKDAVGKRDWHTGLVASNLKNTKRDVYLTRWSKPVRVLSDSEVAQKYKEILDKEDGVKVPWNVVTQSLREELEKVGVPIDYSDKKIGTATFNFEASLRGEYLEQKKNSKSKAKNKTATKYSLTAEQENYFKDSKVRDENGDLKVMYHGTSKGGHTVFDTYGSNYGLFGQGSYFTDNKDVAEFYTNKGYGDNKQVYETYLNITNPLDMDAQGNLEEWQKAFPDADFSDCNTNEEFYRAMEEYFEDEMYSKAEVGEIVMDAVTSMGYDGITHIGGGRVNADGTRHQVYIAFEPEQIKNIDNLKPTENPDIRYSLSEDSEGNKLTEKQSEYFKESKLVDDNGNLKVMYHGSQDAGFHEFESMFSDDGTSFFFVDSNAVAKSYSGTNETYTAPSLHTAEDFNKFFAEIGMDEYEVKEVMHGEHKWFELYEDGDEIASSESPKLLYDEFRDWTGLGTGSANYKVYLNLKNPLIVDAKGRSWDRISSEFSQEVYDRYNSLTEEEKSTLVDLAGWEDVGMFRSELSNAIKSETPDKYIMNLASAYKKLGESDIDFYRLFDIATDNFSDESIRENAVEYLNTREYSQRAKDGGYDGVIFKDIVDNGGYASGMDKFASSTVAIAFDSNQIKSVANTDPTADADIRYSLSDSEGKPIDTARITEDESDVRYSLSHNSEIAKGQSDYIINHKAYVTADELEEAQKVTNAMVDVMMKYSNILPEDKIGKVLTKNGSYDRSVENTTICVRTLAYNEFVDKVQEEIGRPLTQMESFLVSQKLYDIATEPQCLYCYVSLDRKAFNDMLLRYMQDRDTVIAKYNNSDKSPEAIDKLYEEFLNGRKDTKPMKARFDKWLGYVDNGTQLLSLADISTEDRQSVVKANGGILAEQLKDARKYAQSASWSKIQKNYVAYRDEILKLGGRVVKNLNEHYGLRWYSFSDYSPAFIVENMQQITDASIRGLKGLSYTKDTDYAEIFAPSGMNINISMFVNTDADGNFYIDEKQSANFEKALELREKYSNVGIVATVTNDEALRWAGEQEWSDVIIPFHIVRTGTDVAEYYKWLNYTSESADTINDKDMWSAYLDSLNLKSENARKRVSKNIYPNEHKNDKATYLSLCESRGLTPRFVRFAGEDWYMKLVNETRLSADESSPLKPSYNLESAQKSFQKFIEKGGYEGGWYKEGVDVDAEARIVADDVLAGKKANEVEYGRQDGFVPERLISKRKTNRNHGRFSLSEEGVTPKEYGNFNFYGKDILYQPTEDIAPTVSDMEKVAPVDVAKNTTTIPDEYAPMTEEEANAMLEEQNNIATLTDADAPPEIDAPMYDTDEYVPESPLEDRDMSEVGDRKVKAYMYENPEVKPFFQEMAYGMLADLNNTVKGERTYNSQLHYDSGGELGWMGTKRHTSPEIANLLDNWKYTYKQIEDGLNAIIEDNGAENNAVSKRIEFALDEMLREGYTDFFYGVEVPPNQDYINLLRDKEITEYNDKAFNYWLSTLTEDDYKPIEEPIETAQEEIAPTRAFETIKPKPETLTIQEEQWAKNKMARADKVNAEQPIAKILTEETKADKKKSPLWSKIKTNFIDKASPFETLSLKTGNREVDAKFNSIRYADSKAQTLIGEGAEGVKSLNDIQAEVENDGLTQSLYEYLYHKHNVDRMTLADRYDDVPNKAVFGNNVTAKESQEIVNQYEFAEPKLKEYAQEIYNYNKHLRGLLVDGGVISQETADLWEEMYPHYVPIRRVGDEGLNINVALDTGRTGVNAPIKRATGGNRDILPLFDTMAQRTLQTYKAIAKNRFGIELKNTLGTTIENTETSLDEVIDSIDTHDNLLQEGKDGRNPTFTVFENGEKVTFEITEEMYDAMKPTSEGLAYTNKVANTVSNAMRGVLTEYNPTFMLTNAIKDAQDVFINSQHSARTYKNFPKAIKELTTKGKWYTEYMQNGGADNTYFDKQTNSFNKEKSELSKVIGFPLEKISEANNFIERIPRLAEYIASREMGRSIDVSMLDSARVTTNFSAGGDVTKFLNRNGATFLNASVQGATQQVRNIREAKANGLKGWVQLASKVALAGLPALFLNGLLWDDDEEYEELSDYVKQNYYVVAKTQDGKFVRIPKGRTMAVIQEAFTQIQNALTGDDEVDLQNFLELAVSNLAPNNPLDNNIIAPIKQVIENKTWYGEDLVPTRLQDVPDAEQYDESTDAISKWLGEKLNVSPYKINYLLNQYSGGLGDVVLPMLTPKAESGDNSMIGFLGAPMRDKFTTDSVFNNQNTADFYNVSDELKVNANSSNATDEDVLKSKYFNSISTEIGDLYKEKREIQNSNLSNELKYKQVRDIQEQINQITENALNTYENVKINGKYANIGNRHYRMNDDGEWQKITDEQLEKQNEVIGILGITPSQYWGNKAEYDMKAFYPEKYKVLQEQGISVEDYKENYEESAFIYTDDYSWASDNLDKYTLSKAVTNDLSEYKKYTTDLYNIRADKDSNGKSISGSAKEKKIDYINNLDIDYGAKCILIKSQYKSEDSYNDDIVDYLNSRDDISSEEMKTILEELGATIDDEGYIHW